MSIIFTQDYLATAPKMALTITHQDGHVEHREVLDDGNGRLAADVRRCIVRPQDKRDLDSFLSVIRR